MLRTFSAVIIMLVVVTTVIAGGWSFKILLLLAGCGMAYEWYFLTRARPSPYPQIFWDIMGVLWIVIPIFSIYQLREKFLSLLLLVIITDVFAYIVGNIVGGKKLAPTISPGKTWSGAIGGVAMAVIVFYGIASIESDGEGVWRVAATALAISIISQLSDLLESAIKRHFGVKDSGNLIPGHGGLLDRTDSLVLSAPAMLLVFYLFQ